MATHILPLQNKYYLQSIHDIMSSQNLVMYIDGAGTLWHINDLTTGLESIKAASNTAS